MIICPQIRGGYPRTREINRSTFRQNQGQTPIMAVHDATTATSTATTFGESR